MLCNWNVDWVSTLRGADLYLLDVINYNVKITASGNSGLLDVEAERATVAPGKPS